jgi:G:T/U-mismatch repair DNA glycosylase
MLIHKPEILILGTMPGVASLEEQGVYPQRK